MVPADMLQKAGGSGWPMRMDMAGLQPLSPGSPQTLQGPVRVAQPFSRATVWIKEFRARLLWGGRERVSQASQGLESTWGMVASSGTLSLLMPRIHPAVYL